METLKGYGQEVLFVDRGAIRISLVEYSDGSWGIQRDHKTFCVWEPDEIEDCIFTYAVMTGIGHRLLAPVLSYSRRLADDGAISLGHPEYN
jgi:hypothetical protein